MAGASSQKKIDEVVSKLNLNKPEGQLYDATKHGELSNLYDNRQELEKVIKKRGTQIRRGEYGRERRAGDYQEMLKSGNLSTEDRGEVKMFLDTLGKGPSAKPKTLSVKPSSVVPKRRISRPLPDVLAGRISASMEKKLGIEPTNKSRPYIPGGGNRSSNLSSTQGGVGLSPSSSSINPPRLIR